METETSRMISNIRNIMKSIRSSTPSKGTPDWNRPADLVCREDYLYNEKVNAASMTLFPTGCEYAVSGGCTMCGEWSGSNLGQLVSAQYHVAQFAAGCSTLLSEKDIQWLRIYQEGSFLNDAEVFPEAREIILRLASCIKGIRRITIESRPEYLTSKLANEIRHFARNSELEVGIGLESVDDFIRRVCVGKGTSLSVYEKAVNIAHQNNIIALAYIILKPPFLSEKEAIDDAVASTKYAFDLGFDEVYVQAASVHDWSLSELLAQKKLYTPPWLWSMLDVVQKTAHLGKVKIGGLEYFPRPALTSQNYKSTKASEICDCSHGVWSAIQKFNAYGDVNVFSEVDCSCKKIWRETLVEENDPLPLRVSNILPSLSTKEYLSYKGIN